MNPYKKAAITLITALNVYSGQAVALTYQWPIATGVQIEASGSGATSGKKYTVYMSTTTITDNSIKADAAAFDVLKARISGRFNPNKMSWGGYFGVDFLTSRGSVNVTESLELRDQTITFLEWSKILASQFGKGVIKLNFTGGAYGSSCVGTGVWSGSTTNYNVQSIDIDQFMSFYSWDGGKSTCITTPPSNEWCALTEPVITLDFGTLALSNAPSANAHATTKVECTSGIKYALRLTGDELSSIQLNNGMKATLTANSKAMGALMEGVKGLNTVTLGANLAGTGKTGPFTGSGVLIVAYQ